MTTHRQIHITQHTHSIHPCPTLQVIVNSSFLFGHPLITNLVDQESKEIKSTGNIHMHAIRKQCHQ